jgi:acyl-[acyl-carrier-protein]-phospholipid O-acyltransferase/long-chain-fatty-acid--[acyl-carrier-protein] ligase
LGDRFVDETVPLAESATHLWVGSLMCVAIALVGTVTSFLIRRVPPAKPELKFQLSALWIPPETRHVLYRDRALTLAILASCMFWLVSGIAIQAINSLGLVQLKLDKFQTSILTAVIGLGIAMGAVVAGKMCHGRPDNRVVKYGAWGIFLFLLAISISRPDGTHLLGFQGSLVVLVVLGMSAGLFAIPVQVFIQTEPPAGLKGRMIAVMNQANFIAIMMSGVVYTAFDQIVETWGWPRSYIFVMMAALILPVALFYRIPQEENPVTEQAD